MMSRTPRRALALSALLLGTTACGRDWNALTDTDAAVDPSTEDDAEVDADLDADTQSESGARDASDPRRADAGQDAGSTADTEAGAATSRDAGAPPVQPCEAAADRDKGIFVSATGSDAATCGLVTAPCRTLTAALARAQAEGRTHLYLGAGTFEGGQDLRADLTLSGGFDSEWKRDCAAPLRTTIQAPDKAAFALRAADLRGSVRLERLTLLGAAAASVQPGQSVYGLMISGESSLVDLDRVEVRVPNAGHGAAAQSGAPGAAVSGTCATPSSGANGTRGKDGSASAGSYAKLGYQPGSGSAGSAGTPGENGMRTLAVAGSALNYACMMPCSTGKAVTLPKGGDGLAGCGGKPGQGGGAGAGGGSSIAVFVWDGQLRALGGTFAAGHGGNGGSGAEGGVGSDGSAGKSGAAGPVVTVEPSCCGTPTPKTAPGGTGTAGGKGGAGGSGGAGSGGDSYAVYVGGLGRATLEGSALSVGKAGEAGTGPIAGSPGMAAAKNF